MVNGFRYYRALESVSIASALSTALTIYPCQIRVYQRWQSKLTTSYSSEEGVAAGHNEQFTPMRLPVNTVIHTTLVGLEPATFRSLDRRATSSATESTHLCHQWCKPQGSCLGSRLVLDSFLHVSVLALSRQRDALAHLGLDVLASLWQSVESTGVCKV